MADGTTQISEFQNRQNLKILLARRAVLPVWKVESNVHPVTGEAVPMRSRTLVRADQVKSVCEVDDAGAPIVQPPRGLYGRIEIPANHASGLPEGTLVTVHRDDVTLRRFIITQAATEGGEPTKFWLDADHTSPNYDEDADGVDPVTLQASDEDDDL
jgi:hypothetical protein